MGVQGHEPHGPRIPSARPAEGELKLLFAGLQDRALLILREWLVAPDEEPCRLACLAVEENTESGMRMSVILQRCPVGLFTGEKTRCCSPRRVGPLPTAGEELTDHPPPEALRENNDGLPWRADSGADAELNNARRLPHPRRRTR